MGNTLLTPQIIANEALMVLESTLTMASLVHRDYSDEFVEVGDTITVRKPAKFVAQNFTGTTNVQGITEGSVQVKMDRFRDVSIAVTSKEMTLDIKDFSTQVIQPAMMAIAQAIDIDLLTVGIEKAGTTIAGKENATDLKDIASLGRAFDLNKVPQSPRYLAMDPNHKYRYALTDNLSKVSYAGDSKTLREALLGKVYSFDTFMSQNCPNTVAQTPGTFTTLNVTGVAGGTTVNLTGVTPASGTLKQGDAFIVDGYMYRVAEDAAATSGAVENVKIDQPLHAALNAVKAIPVKEANSLAFYRNGLALVTRNLALPMGATNAYIASANGISVRVVFGYDQDHKKDTISFDTIYGIKDLDDSMLAKIKG